MKLYRQVEDLDGYQCAEAIENGEPEFSYRACVRADPPIWERGFQIINRSPVPVSFTFAANEVEFVHGRPRYQESGQIPAVLVPAGRTANVASLGPAAEIAGNCVALQIQPLSIVSQDTSLSLAGARRVSSPFGTMDGARCPELPE